MSTAIDAVGLVVACLGIGEIILFTYWLWQYGTVRARGLQAQRGQA